MLSESGPQGCNLRGLVGAKIGKDSEDPAAALLDVELAIGRMREIQRDGFVHGTRLTADRA